MKMPEYQHEDVTNRDVGFAWLIVGAIFSAMLLLPVVLGASSILALPF